MGKLEFATLEHELRERCEGCAGQVIPGAIWPIQTNEDREHWYVEKCDECDRYITDEMAAGALFKTIRDQGYENVYLLGTKEVTVIGVGGVFVDWVYFGVRGFDESEHPMNPGPLTERQG